MKSKIEEILYKHSERVGLYEGGVITCVDENEFDEIAQEIVKLFAISDVIKSLPDSDEIRMKARELDEKDFAQWMYELQKGNVL